MHFLGSLTISMHDKTRQTYNNISMGSRVKTSIQTCLWLMGVGDLGRFGWFGRVAVVARVQ